MLLKELMTTSGKIIFKDHYIIKELTQPVLGRFEVIPLIKNHIEDGHYANHCVERDQSTHGAELTFVVNNHEDEEDENSGYKIHQHLQHQDQDVEGSQSFLFVFVPFKTINFMLA